MSNKSSELSFSPSKRSQNTKNNITIGNEFEQISPIISQNNNNHHHNFVNNKIDKKENQEENNIQKSE